MLLLAREQHLVDAMAVVCENRIASPAIAMPAVGRTMNGRAAAIGTMRRPIVKITKTPSAISRGERDRPGEVGERQDG